MSIDSIIVAVYLAGILIAGYLIGRHYQKYTSDLEFRTGGNTKKWYQVALTLFAMAADPAIMSLSGLGFLWGFYLIQWNGVHMWITSWVSAMFFVPIYWRSQIVTTPEYLEKRFNLANRVAFSLILTVILIVTLAGAVYMGALLLKNLLGWTIFPSAIAICLVIGTYVIMGGMKTVLTLDFYQGIFVIITLLIVVIMAFIKLGGFSEFACAKLIGNAGVDIATIIPPSDWALTTKTFFPIQAVLTWAPIGGLGWLTCNYGMAQRLLAAKDEENAQKGILAASVLAVFYPMVSFLIGGVVRIMMPEIRPDESFLKVMMEMIPTGLRGILIAGMLAALLSTVDGMLTASSALFSEDFYFRIVRKNASAKERKTVLRIIELITLAITIAMLPVIMKSNSVMTFIQTFYGIVLGVIVAIYISGIFTKRVTPNSAFFAMILGLGMAIAANVFTNINFAYIGFFSFLFTMIVAIIASNFESPIADDKLVNLTIHTLKDVKGPWIGLKNWPGLKKWALIAAIAWFTFSILWEITIRFIVAK